MKCIFIIPPWTHKDSHFEALQDTIAGFWPPLGILYIAAVLREAGYEVKAYDGARFTMRGMVEVLKNENPDFLGVSCVAKLWERAKELMSDVREVLPKVKIAAGGQGPTFLKERCLKECNALDYVVVNEGEYSTLKLLDRIKNSESLSGLLGVYYRDNNEIKFHGDYPFTEDLDSIPFPAIDLLDCKWYVPSVGQYKRLPVGEMMTSRGCPNSCIYCFKIGGDQIRMRSPENIIEEMQRWIDLFEIREMKFWDENFTHDRERVAKICEGMIKKREKYGKQWDVIWSCSGRIDGVDKDLLKLMKRSGCHYIQYGIESGVQKNLDMIGKKITLDQIRETVALTHKYGISMINTFILGIPGETYEEALETIKFAHELNSDYVEFFPCTPFPGTRLYNDIEKYGRLLEPDITKLGMHLLPFVPYTMDENKLRYLQQAAFKGYYMRPSYIWQRLKKIRSWTDVKINLAGLRAILKMNPKKYASSGNMEEPIPTFPVVEKSSC
ncbi:MAG: cobalamin-dependent protein [Candidatus Coatesbacteria bacterium]|nr:cobalamin-dependent protein [Candidatus Coatesbacteria bacterium]